MPLYDYKCSICRRGREVMLHLIELDSAVVLCNNCNGAMNRQISATMIVSDYAPYSCPITGKVIEGRRAHIENLKQHGCRIYEPGETKGQEHRRREADEMLDKAIEETTDRFVSRLPTDKRDKLAAELEGGLTTSLIRSTPTM